MFGPSQRAMDSLISITTVASLVQPFFTAHHSIPLTFPPCHRVFVCHSGIGNHSVSLCKYTFLLRQLGMWMFMVMCHWSGSRCLFSEAPWTLDHHWDLFWISHCYQSPAALVLWNWLLHILQQLLDGVDVEADQLQPWIRAHMVPALVSWQQGPVGPA